MLPQSGELIHGKYRVLRPLADGGMGTIYEARHEVLGTMVALKVLHPNLARRENLVKRFLQEARLSATLVSPHIVRVLDVEQGPQGVLLVMELLRGETLQALLDRQHRLEVPQAIDFTLQMLEGLKVAHEAGVVHRDLKPDNVFITAGPLLKLLDFGIAKLRTSAEFERGLTRPGVVMGTPEYMAPEQAFSADTVDARADIYAMGVLLFEMLSGQRPVRGDDPKQIAQRVFSGHVTALSALLPSLPMNLVSAVHRAMAPNPRGRFDSADDMRQALLPFAPAASPGTAVLGPMNLTTPPAPTQPNPGTLSVSPGGSNTPALSQPPTPAQPSAVSTGAPHFTGPMSAWSGPSGAQPSPSPSVVPPSTARDPAAHAAPSQLPATGAMPVYSSGTPATGYGAAVNAAGQGPAQPSGHGAGSPTAGYGAPPAGATAAHAPLPWSPAGTAPASPLTPGAPAPYGSSTQSAPVYGASPYGGNGYGGNGYGGSVTSYGQPGEPGRGATALGGPSYTSFGSEMPTATPALPLLPTPTPLPPPRRGAPVGLIAVLATLAGGLAVVLALVLRGRGDDGPTPVPTAPTAPTATVTATAPVNPTVPPSLPPLPPVTGLPPAPPPNQGHPAAHHDAGVGGAAGASADGGTDGGLLGLPMPGIPSSLPPLPSSLPAIKIPAIPLPF